MSRLTVASLCANAVLSLAALGWITWIVVQPQHWFADAYAAQDGPIGEQGPRGQRGTTGPPGPVGPDAETAIDELGGSLSAVEASVEKVSIAAFCNAFGYAPSGLLSDAYLNGC